MAGEGKRIEDVVINREKILENMNVIQKNLIVPKGDKVTLSYTINRFKPNYQLFTPTDIDKVKQLIGVPKEVQFKRSSLRSASLSVLQTSLPRIEHLKDPQRKKETVKNVRTAAREYVQGDFEPVATYKSAIEEWMRKGIGDIRLVIFDDIIVESGGVLNVAADTHALYARSIKLYGSAVIYAQGDLTIDCTTMEGNL